MSNPIEIAAAVAATINAIDWPIDWPPDLTPTAEGALVPPTLELLEQLADLTVVVAPASEKRVRVSRFKRLVTTTVEITIAEKLPPVPADAATRLEALNRLAQYLAEFFGDTPRLTERPAACAMDPLERDPFIDVKLLRASGLFATVLKFPIQETEGGIA
jgi:hypothetical protein